MKNKTRNIIIGSTLLTALAGSFVVMAGQGNGSWNGHHHFGSGMADGDHYGQMHGFAQGRGPGFMRGNDGRGANKMGYMRGIRRLDNLSDDQKAQLDELRDSQQAFMRDKHDEMNARRVLMKSQVDAILTDEQRETLSNLNY